MIWEKINLFLIVQLFSDIVWMLTKFHRRMHHKAFEEENNPCSYSCYSIILCLFR